MTTSDPALQAAQLPGRPGGDEQSPETLSGYVRLWLQGVKSGELGSLPIVVALVIIFITFGALNDVFLTSRNFTNLLLQIAPIATIAIGVVFVLLDRKSVV